MVSAQKTASAERQRKTVLKELAEVKKEQQNPVNSLLTAADVGEPDSFGKTVKFFGTAATRGFARSYFADLGLPQTVINNLYRQPMTIRLGMRVAVRNVFFGQYLYAMRLTGN